MREADRELLKRALRHFRNGTLRPTEQGDLRELLVRFNPVAATQSLPELIQLGRVTLGLDAMERYVQEREAAVVA